MAQKKEGGATLWGQPWSFPLLPLCARLWCSSLPSVHVSECWRCFCWGASVSIVMTHSRSFPLWGWVGCVFLHLVWPLTILTLSGGVLEFGVHASTLPKSIAAPAEALRFVPAFPSAENLESSLHHCHSKHGTIRSVLGQGPKRASGFGFHFMGHTWKFSGLTSGRLRGFYGVPRTEPESIEVKTTLSTPPLMAHLPAAICSECAIPARASRGQEQKGGSDGKQAGEGYPPPP